MVAARRREAAPATRTAPRKSEVREAWARDRVVIMLGRQGDGCVYSLHPYAKTLLQANDPNAHAVPHVFIGYDSPNEFESQHGPHWQQIAQLLTGVSLRRLRSLGGAFLWDPQIDPNARSPREIK